ncbi:MAG: RNA polymerase subunit sigma, partial [Bacteroidota bacterium]|nr:RNA polymerase subunit sigma [Bacteroidota bacterium]
MVFDDSNLWDDFRKNKEYALSYIYHHHIEHIYSYGKKFTSYTDLIKDSIQELFFYLILNREHLGFTDK